MKVLKRQWLKGTASLVLAVGLLFFATSASAAWYGNINTSWNWMCAAPTLEQCQDVTWLQENWCGTLQVSAMEAGQECSCKTLLEENAMAIAENLPEKIVVVPDEFGGGTNIAKIEANPNGGVSSVFMPDTYTGKVMNVASKSTNGGLDYITTIIRAMWNLNGEELNSCEEYVYEKYYGYSKFQDATAALHGDPRAILEVAYGNGNLEASIGRRALHGISMVAKNGQPLPSGMWSENMYGEPVFLSYNKLLGPSEEKNPFFKMPFDLIEDPQVLDQLEAGQETWSYWKAYPWYWHYLVSYYTEFAFGFLDEEMEQMRSLGKQFTAEIHTREGLLSGLASLDMIYVEENMGAAAACMEQAMAKAGANGGFGGGGGGGGGGGFGGGGGDDGSLDQCVQEAMSMSPQEIAEIDAMLAPLKESYAADIAESEDRLLDLFGQAQAKGCINAYSLTKCDWAPSLFTSKLNSAYGNMGQEERYQTCLAKTKDDFLPLKVKEFELPDGDPIFEPGPTDYTTNVGNLELYIERLTLAKDAIGTWYGVTAAKLYSTSDTLVDPETNKLQDPEEPFIGGDKLGNDEFGVYYNYSGKWGLDNITKLDAGLCALAAGVELKFDGGGYAFGDENKTEVISLTAEATLKNASLDLKILGESKYVFDKELPTTYNLVNDPKDTSYSGNIIDAKGVFFVLGVPITVEGAITGSVGYNYALNASHSSTEDDNGKCTSVKAQINGSVTPYARLDAEGSVGFDAIVIAAGIKGELLLIDVKLPFKVGLAIEQPTADIEDLSFTAFTRADFELEALSGGLYLWGRFLWWDDQIEIFSWDGIEYTKNLFDASYEINLYNLATVKDGQDD